MADTSEVYCNRCYKDGFNKGINIARSGLVGRVIGGVVAACTYMSLTQK